MSYPITPINFGPSAFEPLEHTFKLLGFNHGILPLARFLNGGDLHAHFGVISDGNITSGKTTVRLPGGRKCHLDWNR